MNSVAAFWRNFSETADRIERRSPFDPLSKFVYAIVFGATLVEVALLFATGFGVNALALRQIFIFALSFACIGLLARAYGFPRVAIVLEAVSLPSIIAALTGCALQLVTLISGPLVDPWLAAADRAFGFDWMAFYRFNLARPWLVHASEQAYFSLNWQVMLLPFIMAASGRSTHIWRFLTAWAIILLAVVLIFPLMPAAGPLPFFHIPQGQLPLKVFTAPWAVPETIELIKSGHVHEISFGRSGIVSFPSAHAAAALLMTWFAWRNRWLRYPILALNLLMLYSTILIGGHYLVDLISGCAIAIAAIILSHRLCPRSAPPSGADAVPR